MGMSEKLAKDEGCQKTAAVVEHAGNTCINMSIGTVLGSNAYGCTCFDDACRMLKK